MRPGHRVVDAPIARQLVGFLAVLASALPVTLPGQAPVAAALGAGQPERQGEVDQGGTASTPLLCCSAPRAVSTIARRALASNRTAACCSATLTPVMRSTRSGQ